MTGGPSAGPATSQRPVAFGRHEQSAGTVRVQPQSASRSAIPPGDRPTDPADEGLS